MSATRVSRLFKTQSKNNKNNKNDKNDKNNTPSIIGCECSNCSIKFDPDVVYRVPQVLRCGHSYCNRCIERIAKKVVNETDDKSDGDYQIVVDNDAHKQHDKHTDQIVCCPECSTLTPFSSVCTNVSLTRVLRVMLNRPEPSEAPLPLCQSETSSPSTLKHPCAECESTESRYWCKSCDSDLCDECFTLIHSVSSTLSKHARILISKKRIQTPCCREHEDCNTDIYCPKCDILVCNICMISQHQLHGCESVHSITDPSMNERIQNKIHLEMSLEKLSGIKKNIRKRKLDVDEAIAIIGTHADIARESVKKATTTLIQAVENRSHVLLSDVSDHEGKRVAELTRLKANLESAELEAESLKEEIHKIRKFDSSGVMELEASSANSASASRRSVESVTKNVNSFVSRADGYGNGETGDGVTCSENEYDFSFTIPPMSKALDGWTVHLGRDDLSEWTLKLSSSYPGLANTKESLTDDNYATGCGTNASTEFIEADFPKAVTVNSITVGCSQALGGGWCAAYLEGAQIQAWNASDNNWDTLTTISGLLDGVDKTFPLTPPRKSNQFRIFKVGFLCISKLRFD